MAEELGAAVLRVTVDTRQATQALEAFRTQFSQQLGDLGKINFSGLDKGAADAGAKAGAAIRSSLQQALNNGGAVQLPQVKAPDLRNIREALDISGQLNATLADLRAYQKGLEAVRESASATDPLFKRLTATIGETRNAIKAFESGTGDLVESLAQVKNVAAGITFAAQIAALDAFRSGLKAVATTALDTTKAVAGIAAKGAVETLKVPIFGLPKDATGAIDKARAQIERLQKQAETASGKVARLTEGVATLGAGGVAAKGIVDLLGGIGDQAGTTASLLGGVADALNSLPGPLKGLGGIADIFASGTTSIQQWVSGVLQAQTELSAFTGPLQAVTDSLTALGPEAALVGGALAFTFAGFQDLINQSFKPGVEGARKALRGMTDDTQRLLEALARASEAAQGLASLRDLKLAQRDAADRAQAAPVGSDENLQATQELVQLNKLISSEKQKQFYLEQQLTLGERERAQIAQRLRDAASPAAPLALPSSDLLQQRVRDTGSLPPQRLQPGMNASNEQAVAALKQQVTEAQNLASAQRQNQASQTALNVVLEQGLQVMRTMVDVIDEQVQGYRFQTEQLQDQIAAQQQLRQLEAQRTREARSRNAAEAAERKKRQEGIQNYYADLRAQDFERRLSAVQQRNRAQAERRKRVGEAGSNALIGGAFPLLFGQGLGASIGGAAGGGLGGFAGGQLGFGLSLLGTAVGAQFDLATQKAGTLAAALKDPIGRFSELQQAGLLSSKGLERQVEALISTGRAAEAAALIQQDLANTYGTLGNAKALADQTDRLGRSWSQLTITLANLVVSPVANLLQSTSDGLSGLASALLTVGQALPKIEGLIPKPVREAGKFASNQLLASALPGGIGQLANLVSIGGKAAGSLTGLFVGGGGNKPSPQVQAAVAAQKELTRLTQQQAVAEASGNRVLAVGTQLIAARVKLQQDLAALSEEDRRGPKGDQLRQQYQQTVAVTQAQAKAAADASERELAATRQLVGLSGDALTREQERLRVAEARRVANEAADALKTIRATPGADPKAVQAAEATARATETAYRNAYETAKNAAELRIKAGERELAIAKATLGLGREAAAIVRQRLEFQQRFGDLQKERKTASDRFAAVMANPRATNDERVFAANAFIEAANNVKLAGIDFYNKIVDAAKQARDNLLSASLNRAQQLGNRDQGLNRFLAPSIVEKRQFESAQTLNEQLKPVVKQYWSSFSNETRTLITRFQASLKPTVIAGTINGQPVAGYNAPPSQQDRDTIAAIIQSAKEEQDGKQALIDANNAVVASNQALSSGAQALAALLPPLAEIMNGLVGKDWTVNVNVPGGSASGAVLGAVNGGLGR